MRLTDIADADTGPIVASLGAEVTPFVVPMRAAPCSEPVPHASGDAVAQVTRLTEALRRARKGGASASAVSDELASAETSLARRIRAHIVRGNVRVTLTDNRYTMISVRRQPRGHGQRTYDVRLHCMFADADPVITRALARYIAENDRDASRVLGDFIDANQEVVRGRARKSPQQVILTAGDHHDLRAIFDELNARYFDNAIEAAITWGARTGRPRRRHSIKMGSYSVEERLIRLHRSLDRAFVPRFFVEWIVFHEMLHQVHDIKVKNGRREFHSKAFLADEARFERYDEARAWERAHLDELLTY
ncbi:MAG: M48 family metallopeptidase [Kofleriaceae bacterium]|nr:MAG: M48 family metallopeptidase [Kofleriaceae bacterium]